MAKTRCDSLYDLWPVSPRHSPPAAPWVVFKAMAVMAAALVYGALAIFVFDRGLNRYASDNRMVVNR